MTEPITSKTDMYRELVRGTFGNTVPVWDDLSHLRLARTMEFPWPWESYGIRSKSPRGRFDAFVPYKSLESVLAARHDQCIISPMVDDVATVLMWANVYEDTFGLNVEYRILPPRGLPWREGMQNPTHALGIKARMILKAAMNSASWDDLDILLNEYPYHVIELTVLDRCIGTLPNRNSIVWEVRGNY